MCLFCGHLNPVTRRHELPSLQKCKSAPFAGRKLVPLPGFEPATFGLQARGTPRAAVGRASPFARFRASQNRPQRRPGLLHWPSGRSQRRFWFATATHVGDGTAARLHPHGSGCAPPARMRAITSPSDNGRRLWAARAALSDAHRGLTVRPRRGHGRRRATSSYSPARRLAAPSRFSRPRGVQPGQLRPSVQPPIQPSAAASATRPLRSAGSHRSFTPRQPCARVSRAWRGKGWRRHLVARERRRDLRGVT
jgi:hypothetical protein